MATEREVASEPEGGSGIALVRSCGRRRNGMAAARKRIVDAMPGIAETLAEKATEGSVAHVKLAFELAGLEKKPGRKVARKPRYMQRDERELLSEIEGQGLPKPGPAVGAR